MRNQRADCCSVETLAYTSCQATDHTLSRYRHTLPLPSQTPTPLRITCSGCVWQTYRVAHPWRWPTTKLIPGNWLSRRLLTGPISAHQWLRHATVIKRKAAAGWRPWPGGVSRPLLPVPASVPACFSMTVVRCRKPWIRLSINNRLIPIRLSINEKIR